MSRLNKLLAKPEEFDIGGEKFSFEPLTVNEMDLIIGLEDANLKVRSKALRDVIDLTLKKSVPDATKEEIGNISLVHMKLINQAILKVNGLGNKDVSEPKDKTAPE